MNAVISDIQRASVHDGPGLRTTVFFKGCPLNCKWCHNPECIDFNKQILCYPEKCIKCGQCEKGCYSGAKVVCGKEVSVNDVLEQVLLDKEFYKNGGGVTFSGGEPLAQRDFLNAIIDRCREKGIGCAVETSLIFYDEEIFKKLDIIMADFKIWNNDIHKEYTGVSNKKIIENFKKLNELDKPIIARTPVIPEISQGIDKISEFLKSLRNVIKYELLPYHPLGNSKRLALGMEKDNFSVPEKEYMEKLKFYSFTRGEE
jgi:pyruvate formate lyase activating enzyme